METNKNDKIISYKSTHPGNILKDWLYELNIKQKDFAEQIGVPTSRLNEIIKCKKSITSDFAERLEKSLGMKSDYWLRLQANYDYNEKMKRFLCDAEKIANEQELQLKQIFNLKEIYKRLDIKAGVSILRIKELLNIFNTTFDELTKMALNVGFFKHSDTLRIDEKNIRTWVLLAQYETQQIHTTAKFNDKQNAKCAAIEIATMANKQNIEETTIKKILAKYGIKYAVFQKLELCPVDAYSFVLNEVPAIVVTHRHNNMQKLIFDVLHELGHLYLHADDKVHEFLNIECDKTSNIEKEADIFARDLLIPTSVWSKIKSISVRSINPNVIYSKIGKMAELYNVNPIIAVERYKHESKEYRGSVYNHTKIS